MSWDLFNLFSLVSYIVVNSNKTKWQCLMCVSLSGIVNNHKDMIITAAYIAYIVTICIQYAVPLRLQHYRHYHPHSLPNNLIIHIFVAIFKVDLGWLAYTPSCSSNLKEVVKVLHQVIQLVVCYAETLYTTVLPLFQPLCVDFRRNYVVKLEK